MTEVLAGHLLFFKSSSVVSRRSSCVATNRLNTVFCLASRLPLDSPVVVSEHSVYDIMCACGCECVCVCVCVCGEYMLHMYICVLLISNIRMGP